MLTLLFNITKILETIKIFYEAYNFIKKVWNINNATLLCT